MQDSAAVLAMLAAVDRALLPALGCWVNIGCWVDKSNTQPRIGEGHVVQKHGATAATTANLNVLQKCDLTTRLQVNKQPYANRRAATTRTAHSTRDARIVA
jgi:hypothetical protein